MQEIAEAVLDAEMKVGELLKKTIPHEGGRKKQSSPSDRLSDIGISKNQSSQFQSLAKHPEIVEKAKQEARKRGEVVTRFVNIPLSRFVVRWSWGKERRGWKKQVMTGEIDIQVAKFQVEI